MGGERKKKRKKERKRVVLEKSFSSPHLSQLFSVNQFTTTFFVCMSSAFVTRA